MVKHVFNLQDNTGSYTKELLSNSANSIVEFRDAIYINIKDFLNRYLCDLTSFYENLTNEMFEYAEDFIAEALESAYGGKCIRSITFLQTVNQELVKRGECSSSSPGKNALTSRDSFLNNIAISFELFHSSMLVHDDIIDNDKTRRGRKASHITLGTNEAILLGDILLSAADYAFQTGIDGLVSMKTTSESVRSEVLLIWSRMKRDVLIGQVVDTRMTKFDIKNKTKKALTDASSKSNFIAAMKTASYTTVAPRIIALTIGKNAVSFDIKDFRNVLDMAVADGIRFQAENDAIGMEKDIKSGNMSGLMIALIDRVYADKSVRNELFEIFTKKSKVDKKDIARISEILET